MQPELGTFHLGANLDTRPPAQAAHEDIKAAETIASAVAVNWQEIPPEQIRTFGVQDQSGKSDCVAETRRKIKRVLLKVNKGVDIDFSSAAFYRARSNYPGAGMIAGNAIQMDADNGMTLDLLVPSDAITSESAANALVVDPINVGVAKAFAVQNGEVIFTPGDLETPAGTIQTSRKAVMVWFYATVAEWAQLVPTVQTHLTGPGDPLAVVVHSVTAIEPALYQGKKGFWIDDSAHFAGLSRRFITEEFYKARNWWASYPLAFKFEPSAIAHKPQHTFDHDLEFSPVFNVDPEVVALQDCLKYEACFPTNVDSTGYYGALTRMAVAEYQAKHGIVVAPDAPGYGRCGPITRKALNAEFSN